MLSSSLAVPTGDASGNVGAVEQSVADEKSAQDAKTAGISAPSGAPEPRVIAKEEKIEYRDQNGNVLNDDQVKELEGKVEFKTKYETRTRVVDEKGNELPVPDGGWPAEFAAGVAPPHPDVQGVDKETVKVDDAKPPRDAAASRDGEKEAEWAKAKPASEGQEEATGRDEL